MKKGLISNLLSDTPLLIDDSNLLRDNDGYITKGLQTLKTIQDLTLTLQSPYTAQNSSASIITALQAIVPALPFIASPGYAYTLFGSNSKVNPTKGYFSTIHSQLDDLKDYYYNYAYFLLKSQGEDKCSAVLDLTY